MALYAFDGTWNSATLHDDVEQEDETNVAKFCEAYTGNVFYVPGPGTRFGRVGKVVGGVAGMGGRSRVREAYDQLCANWANRDHVIDIVGFSRGAALALDFANKIADDGIRRVGTRDVAEDDPPMRFLGLWDLVGSFGVPINVGPLDFQEINLGHKLDVPGNVTHCVHAIALDERRQTFRVTRLLNAWEVWFRGVHSDVGGGNGNVGLSSIALRWMLRKASAAGLPIDDRMATACDAKANSDAPLKPSKDPIPNEHRGSLRGDRVHYSVVPRQDHHNPGAEMLRETEQDERNAVRLEDIPQRSAAPA